MRSPFFVIVALTAAMLPTAVRAQSAPRSEDLRTEIRRIVREELHKAMLQMHGDMAPVHAEAHAGANAKVVEKVDVEVQAMNDLIGQIEKEIATNEQHLRRLGIAEPKSGGDGMQMQTEDGGTLSLVLGNGELRAADGKAKVKKPSKTKAKKPGKNKNKNKTGGDQPVELRLDGMQLHLEGAGDGESMQLTLPGMSGHASGCDCGCPCCGAGKAMTGNTEKSTQPRVMFLGEPKTGEAGNGGFSIRLQSADDGDDDGDEMRKLAPAAKPGAPKAKTGQSHTILFGGSERGEAGKGKAGVDGHARGDDGDDDQGEQVRKVAPKKDPGASKAAPHVLRIGRLLV